MSQSVMEDLIDQRKRAANAASGKAAPAQLIPSPLAAQEVAAKMRVG